ncbi:MAG: hypothetical protein H8E17_11615 [Deltaproteobacteria bacterium]|nr:hypothetical protein [Deltaproteobacteria bacterium]
MLNILIHDNDTDFSRRWVEYCKEKQYNYEMVNCISNEIISKFKTADILLWCWHHIDHAEVIAARYILAAAESMGLKVFPDVQTCLTYDNKLAQKYQLEAVGAPLVPTYVFYDKLSALEWADRTSYPKVFKLSKGAGSRNVSLVRSKKEAAGLIHKAFSSGFKPVSGQMRDVMIKFKGSETRKTLDLLGKVRRLPATLKNIYVRNKYLGREKGYVYFQDFIPENEFDTRVTIIGNRAFGLTRGIRQDDFRASGSGLLSLDPQKIDERCIHIAFDMANKLDTQSLALDFVKDPNGIPLIVESSYTYVPKCVYDFGGHWDPELNWHEGNIWPQDAILEDLIEKVNHSKG